MYPGVGVEEARDEEMPVGLGNPLSLAEEGRGQPSKTDTFRQNYSTAAKHHRKHYGLTPTSNNPVEKLDFYLHQIMMNPKPPPHWVVSEKTK